MPAKKVAKKTVAKKVAKKVVKDIKETPKEEVVEVSQEPVEVKDTEVKDTPKVVRYRGEEVLASDNVIINGRLHVEVRTSTQTTLVSPDEWEELTK